MAIIRNRFAQGTKKSKTLHMHRCSSNARYLSKKCHKGSVALLSHNTLK